MNDKNLGIALTSQKIIIGNKAEFISPYVYQYVEQELDFDNGGRLPVNVGDVIRGVKSGVTAIVIGVNPTMGKWEDNNVSGTFRIKSASGLFVDGESLSIGPEADKATVASVQRDCNDDYPHKNELNKCIYISVIPGKDSLVDHRAVVIALEGSTLDYNYMLGHVIPESKKWIVYGEEAKKTNFINFVQGSRGVIILTGYF